jgi:hypothetical protein
MTLKQQKQIALNEYLLEIQRLKSSESETLNIGYTEEDHIIPIKFANGLCRYIDATFAYTSYKHERWIKKYKRQNSAYWAKTPSAYLRMAGNKKDILKALKVRVKNLLIELNERI